MASLPSAGWDGEEEEWTGGEACPLFSERASSSDDECWDSNQTSANAAPVYLSGIAPVDSIDHERMSNQLFLEVYRMKKPVIMKNFCLAWGATQSWGESGFLSSCISSPDGTTLVAKDNLNFLYHELCDVSSISAGEAIAQILDSQEKVDGDSRMYTRLYIDAHPELLSFIDTENLSHLASTIDGSVTFVPKNVGVWVSSQGCITPLHYDLCHGFLSQVVGAKRFLLASPDETQYLYRNNSIATKNQTSSKVDLPTWMENDAEERKKFPNVGEVQWFCADLSPGDVLYTPPGWWHSVSSVCKSVSVLLPFDMIEGEHLSVLQSL